MPVVVNVFNDSGRKYLPSKKIEEVARAVLKGEKKKSAEVSVVLTSNKKIRSINKKYLGHDYNTDVISFTLDETPALTGEIYISVDQAALQAKEYGVSLRNELLRLTAHGTLHIAGYDDYSLEERNIMHKFENYYIENFLK